MMNKRQRLFSIVGLLALILLIILFSVVFMKQAAQKEPKVGDHTILHPSFATAIGEFSAGTIFLTKVEGDDRLLAITALHIFGPSSGLPRQYSTTELKAFIRDVSIEDAFDQQHQQLAWRLEPVAVRDAVVNKSHAVGDLALFLVTGCKENLPYFKFGLKAVKAGDRVWLATRVSSGADAALRTHRGNVVSVNKNEIKVKYDNSKLAFSGTSGSPILNENGEVIGINTGKSIENGVVLGYANPAIEAYGLVRRALQSQVK